MRSERTKVPRAALLALAVLAFLCARSDARSPQTEVPAPSTPEARAALAIDGELVPWEEYACWLVRFQGEQHVPAFARRRALERAAEAAGIRLTDDEVRAIVDAQVAERVRSAFGGDRAGWLEELTRLGQTEADYYALRMEEARAEEWAARLVKLRRTIGEDELRAAWEREYGPGGRRYDVRLLHLRVPPPPGRSGMTREEAQEAQRAAREPIEARARALRERALAGEDFEALVREHSEDAASRSLDGRVPGFEETRAWGAASVAAVRALDVGAITEPIYARGGYNLFLVADVDVTPFESVAPELRRRLEDMPPNAGETRALLSDLTGGEAIEILPELAREVRGAGTEPQSWRLERPVLTLGGAPISRGEFAAWLTTTEGRALARSFVETFLVERLAAEEGIRVSSAEVERRLREDVEHRIALYHKGDRDAWLASIAERGVSEGGHLRTLAMRVRHDLLAERLMVARRVVTPEMVRAEWEARHGEDGRSPDVRSIRRDLREPADGEITTQEELEEYIARESAAALEMLADLRARVAAGEDFATLARLYSQDPATRENGGRPADRFLLHTWPKEVQDAIRALEPGQTTEPMELAHRFYLFELVGTTVVPLEAVEDDIRKELKERRPAMVEIAGFANELYQQHEVRVLPGMYGS